MQRRRLWVACYAAGLLVLSLAVTVRAQATGGMSTPTTTKPAESTPQTDPRNPSLWNADRMMEDAVQTLTRRYNLNPEQEAYTRKLLTTRVRAYLADHETELRQLIRESLEMQIDPRKANAENYKRWGERARPLFERAKKDILEGNKEWGEILNDAQKQIHKFDLDMMAQNFGQIDNLITKWSAGKYAPGDTSPKPPPQIAQDTQHRVSRNPASVERKTLEDIWQVYVTSYGSTFRFNPEQVNSARAILQDCRARAQAYRDRRKSEMTQIDARVNEASAAMARAAAGPDSQAANARLLEANASKAELEAPIGDIFKDLQQRMDEIPTKSQRDAVPPAQVTSLEGLAKACLPAAPVQTPTTVGPSSPAKPGNQRPSTTVPPTTRPDATPASKPAASH
jgi:hypothetical protein